MDIKPLIKDKYENWDKFCLQSDDAWFWHTSDWLEYNLQYKPELSPENQSFFVESEGKILAICPLIIETYNDGAREFSIGGLHIPVVALENNLPSRLREKVMKLVFSEIATLAEKHNVNRTKFRFSVLNRSFISAKHPPFNFLIKHGYLDNSINTQVIDLSADSLWSDIRHGHKYAINQAKKIFTINIHEGEASDKEAFSRYTKIHHLAAGKITRPKVTFDMMWNWLKKGLAVLAEAKKNDRSITFAFVFLYKGCAYYGSGCTDPEFASSSASHLVQWTLIEQLKKKDLRYYEIGWQRYGNILSSNFADLKELQISKFKRGFGGFSVPLFRGEKFYDREYFLKIYQSRVKGYYNWLSKEHDF